jgi:hypothetical protein
MATVRVVPTQVSKHGSVMCFVERTEKEPFPEVTQIAFAVAPDGEPGPVAEILQSSLGSRLYFVAPTGDQPACDQLILIDSGDRLLLETPLESAALGSAEVRALRTQMEALSEAMAAFVAAERLLGFAAEAIRSIYLAAVGDAHVRLADTLEIIEAETPGIAAEQISLEDIVNGLVAENQARMDGFLKGAFDF